MELHLSFRHYFLIFIMAVFCTALFLREGMVKAQTTTVVSIQPSEPSLFLNGIFSADVQINVSNVIDLNAFDIILTYDPAYVAITGWSLGDFLQSSSCFLQINDPGYFRRSCVQFNAPGVSGNGTLLNITFQAITKGESPLAIEKAELSNKDNQLIPLEEQNATITVGYAASAVVGNFLLQSQSNRAGIPVSLSPGVTYSQGPYDVLSIHDLYQNLVFPSVVNNDSYTLTTSQPGYLNLSRTVTVPPDAGLTLPPLRLLAGDAVADNAINTADLDAIRDAFGTMGEGISADVNFDGVVDLRDLALTAGNYGLTPAEAYADCLP